MSRSVSAFVTGLRYARRASVETILDAHPSSLAAFALRPCSVRHVKMR
jgi:hypothetical protein